jgi:hypothetical protein
MMVKEEVVHKDKLGRILNVGDTVVYPSSNSLVVGTVKKLNPKMVKVAEVGVVSRWYTGNNKYPSDIVVVDGPEVSMYLLKIATKS